MSRKTEKKRTSKVAKFKLPKKEDAEILVALWQQRHQDWISGGKQDSYLEWILEEAGSCPYCQEIRSYSLPQDPFYYCLQDPFKSPCFNTYIAFKRKINGLLSLPEVEQIFIDEEQNMLNILDENW